MQAVEYDQYGPPRVLETRTVTRPRADHGQALVRVHASSVNPIDTIIRSGKLRLRTGRKFPKRIGIDFVGEIVEIETEAPDFKVGDRVWGVMLSVESGVGQGTAAEFVTISTTRISLSPKSLNFIEAAAISSVGAVAIITLRDKAKLRPGERLLVRGAAGGVGCMAVQLGKVLGAHVTALASAHDLVFLKELGADEALDYRTTTPSSLEPFDVVLDLVGTNLSKYRGLLSRRGRMYCLALSSRSIAYMLASHIFGSKRVQFFSAAPMRDTMTDLAAYVDAGSIRPVVHSIYGLDKIAEAHLSLEAGGGRGKRVVKHTDG
ncbi:MAG: NAD(P)-dependent alcohol dehydrogenase [Herpetosiphonaceae bacterium]|nr:NAD(P)-dependent alcohol dehydrogenase [Herpetosiphonaceae bacterium]